jgi:hypothetical protein
MKVRKILMMTLVLTLIFGTAVFAENISQTMRVVINKKELDDAGLLVDNKAYLAVGTLSKAMQAMVSWDNEDKKVTINKPNVHMFTMMDNSPFGSVNKNSRIKFYVFSQVDNLKTDINGFKLTITDPYGEDTWIDGRDTGDKDFPSDKDNFWFKTKEVSYEFKSSGAYVIRFWMKQQGSSTMQVVAEKVINSKS